jgi:hypothetical protein
MERGMSGVQQSIQLAALPACHHVKSDVDGCGDPPKDGQRNRTDTPALDPRDRRSRHRRACRNVALPQPSSDPNRSQCRPDPLIAHAEILGTTAYPRRIAEFTRTYGVEASVPEDQYRRPSSVDLGRCGKLPVARTPTRVGNGVRTLG